MKKNLKLNVKQEKIVLFKNFPLIHISPNLE